MKTDFQKNKVKNTFGDKVSEIILNRAGQLRQMEKLYHEIFDNTKEKIIIDENLTVKRISRKELKNNLFYYALSQNPTTLTEAIIIKHFSKPQAWKTKKEIENYSRQHGVIKNFDFRNELKSKCENEMNLLMKN